MTTFGRRGTGAVAPGPTPRAGAPARTAPASAAAVEEPLPYIDLTPETDLDAELKAWKAARRAGGWSTRGRWRELAAAAALAGAVVRLTVHNSMTWPLSLGLGAMAMLFGFVGWMKPSR